MCGRYAFFSINELKRRFNIQDSELSLAVPSYNIPPYTQICALLGGHARYMHWQLIPSFSEEFKTQYSMFNTRVESFSDSNFKKNLLLKSRCLIPADNYYEWKKTGRAKEAYLIRRPDRSIICFAGIYSVWIDSSSGERRLSCSIITRDSNPELSIIHPRMPAIISGCFIDEWLSEIPSLARAREIIEESADLELEYYRVSDMVNSTANNKPGIMVPLKK